MREPRLRGVSHLLEVTQLASVKVTLEALLVTTRQMQEVGMLLLLWIPKSRFPESPEISHTEWAWEHHLCYPSKECGIRRGGVWLGERQAGGGGVDFLWQPRSKPWRTQGQHLGSRSGAAWDTLATVSGVSGISHAMVLDELVFVYMSEWQRAEPSPRDIIWPTGSSHAWSQPYTYIFEWHESNNSLIFA